VSTAQVLHPELYAAGVLPREVGEPKIPPTVESLSSGVLGEARLALWLSRFSSYLDARDAVDGWAGDRYTVASIGSAPPALLLTLVADGPEAAQRMAAALAGDPAVHQARRGARVAVVRGDAGSLAPALLEALLTVAVRELDNHPINNRSVHAIEHADASPTDTTVAILELGIVGTVPAGLRVYQGRFAPLVVRGVGKVGLLSIAPDTSAIPGSWHAARAHHVQIALGNALVTDGSCPSNCRRYIVPICEGKKNALFLTTGADETTLDALDAWVRSFRAMPTPGTECPH
jgi:hypothetical protein